MAEIPTAANMTDGEFKEMVVASYNRCAAELAVYKRALEFIASIKDGPITGDPTHMAVRMRHEARQALRHHG